jgi:predicted phage-related endonuclease
MSTEIDKGVVVFDEQAAHWLERYKDALSKIKEWQEVADIARAHLENELGDNEEGFYQGRRVLRWTSVTSNRFDVKKAREILPEQVLDLLNVQQSSRRFTLCEDE